MRVAPSFALLLAPLVCLLLSQCNAVPRAGDKPVSRALPIPKSGPLVVASKRLASGRSKGHSSFLLIEDNKEALDWRLALIDSAQSSLDIQLYLWQKSSSSSLLFDRVLRAAERGVRVRVLVDDFLFSTSEKHIAAICRYHPNLDIRIFNPTVLRGNPIGSTVEFLLNFQHLNRRMHNKTWTADGLFTIVGGRNVHDHYFGLDENYNFYDLDVMAVGPVVEDVSAGFDLFWNSSKAYPGALLSKRGKPEHVLDVKDDIARRLAEERNGKLRSFPIARKNWSRELASLPAKMARGRGEFLQDHPDPELDDRHVVASIRSVMREKKGELIFVTPYLIPSDGAIQRVREATESGIRVGILAPSLAANNQPAAHAHYKKKRKALLEAGARLYEMKDDPSGRVRAWADTDPVHSKIVALHAKAVVGDRKRCFIGSLNLDPRAMEINTESGLLIDSPQLSNQLLGDLRDLVYGDDAWELTLDEKGKLTWTTKNGQALDGKPPAPFGKKVMSWIIGWLPIESQL